jgi:hypothetical protein
MSAPLPDGIDAETRRLWLEWLVRESPPRYLRDWPKQRFIRALFELALEGQRPTISVAAQMAGVPRGTVSTWIHRYPSIREAVLYVRERDFAQRSGRYADAAERADG